MPMERPRPRYKRRTREHVIADLAVHHVEGPILRCGFTAERIVHDYGVDLWMNTYTTNGEPESDWVLFQVKATDNLKRSEDGAGIVFRIDQVDLARWADETYPVILVVYDAKGDVAYWLYVQAHLAAQQKRRPRRGQTITVHIPAVNVFDEIAIRHFAAAKAAIQRQAKGVVDHGLWSSVP
jgi:hypothetical protein